MIVFRVECVHGGGPFNRTICRSVGGECKRVHISTGWFTHPTPAEDGIGHWMREQDICGVKDMRGIVFWFPNKWLRQRLHESGYSISIYEVDEMDCWVLNTQVVFIGQYATFVGSIPLGIDMPARALVGS